MATQQVPNFMGTGQEVQFLESSLEAAGSGPGEELDLVAMAHRCQNYLANNPLAERGYECRFSFWGLHLPVFDPWPYCAEGTPVPDLGVVDPIASGDTDSRMDYAYVYMREMAGSYPAVEAAERGVRARVRSYLHDDGLSWVRGPIANFDAEGDHPHPWAVIWTTAKALWTEAELFRLTGDEAHRDLAHRLFAGLRGLALWDTGRAYFGGGSWYNGEWSLATGAPAYYFVVEPLVRYWEVAGDQEALDFARAYADGMLANLQPGLGTGGVQEDGSFYAHVHCTMHAISGVAHLGAVLREPRYVEWARRVYEWVRAQGTDYGWFPEVLGSWSFQDGKDLEEEHRRHTEICLVADMTVIALWLGEAGYPEYFDHAERYVRNMLRHAQFFVTPEMEALYRRVHQGEPPEAVEKELALLRSIQGGFVATPTPNDWVDADLEHHGTAGDPPLLLDMMGCCPPEGMRALWSAWRHTVTPRPEGIYVNMSLPCCHEQAEVSTCLPAQGVTTIKARQEGTYFLRPPCWAPRKEVRLYRQQQEVEPDWRGDYIRTDRLQPGEEVSLGYSLVSFVQEQDLQAGGNSGTYQITWRGNTVVDLKPRGKYLPLFDERPLPPPAG